MFFSAYYEEETGSTANSCATNCLPSAPCFFFAYYEVAESLGTETRTPARS
jgi:hypothetical protein